MSVTSPLMSQHVKLNPHTQQYVFLWLVQHSSIYLFTVIHLFFVTRSFPVLNMPGFIFFVSQN